MRDSANRLYNSILAARDHDPKFSRTSKLIHDGMRTMVKKLANEALDVGLEAVQMDRQGTVKKSVNLLWYLAMVWAESGVTPEDVAAEIERRERLYGIAEKLPKNGDSKAQKGSRFKPAEA